MANSIITTSGDGSTTVFSLSFTLGFISRSHVRCRVNNEVDGLGDPIYRELEWINDGMVRILGATPGVGVPIVFSRTVPKDVLQHDYTDGAPISAGNLDESNLQVMHAVHEFLDGRFTGSFATDLNMNGFKITDLADPVADTDAVNLQTLQDYTGNAPAYAAQAQAAALAADASANAADASAEAADTSADTAQTWAEIAQNAASGLNWTKARAATTAPLPSCTYSNGMSGVGATLTGTANGALPTQDGVTLAHNDVLLVRGQASGLQNGLYRLTTVGNASTPFVLTRATNADSWDDLVSKVVVLEEGTNYAEQAFICSVNVGGTIGTTAVTWVSFTPPLADGAVSTSAKIVDGIVTYAKLAASVIATAAEIAASTANKLVNAAQLKLFIDTYVVTPWVAYTPTITNMGTITTQSFFSRRCGDTLEVRGYFVCAAAPAAVPTISIGHAGTNGNVSFATTKFISGTNYEILGVAGINSNNSNTYTVIAKSNDANVVSIGVWNGGASFNPMVPATSSSIIPIGASMYVSFKVPIQGW